jgi:two-component system, NarL family, response regulator NreC
MAKECRQVVILVVEDFEPFRRFICLLLRERGGCEVIEASDGLEAVEKAKDLQPDLILFDIGLPKLNGIKSAEQVRMLSPHTKLLFVSAESDSNIVREVLSLGAQGYVHKQHVVSDLLPAVEAILEGKQFVSCSLEFSDSADAQPSQRESAYVADIAG